MPTSPKGTIIFYRKLVAEMEEEIRVLNSRASSRSVEERLEDVKIKIQLQEALKKAQNKLTRLERIAEIERAAVHAEKQSGVRPLPKPPEEKPVYDETQDDLRELKQALKRK